MRHDRRLLYPCLFGTGAREGILEARTIGVGIERNWQEVYDFAARPENFPKWATGLGTALNLVNGVWVAETAQGPMTVRFTPRNPYGVLDHEVAPASGPPTYVPLRVVPNDEGAEVMLTLFRQAGKSDAAFDRDAAWVVGDLRRLKEVLEG